MRSSSKIRLLLVLPLLASCREGLPSRAPKVAAVGLGQSSPVTVSASPDVAKEMQLAADETPIALAASPRASEVAVVVHGAENRYRVVKWVAGEDHTTLVAELPKGFVARAIAAHPSGRGLFVTGSLEDSSAIISLTDDGGHWQSHTLFRSAREVGRIIVGTRPFYTRENARYRLFFASRLPNGTSSLRTITETGNVEYQVAGPQSSAVALKNEDVQPTGVIAESALPIATHPSGQPLIWQDRHGCPHATEYSDNWGDDKQIAGLPCGGSFSLTPNGVFFLRWQSGQPGIEIFRDRHGAEGRQATEYTFLDAPVSTPDGHGIIGVISKGGHPSLVYAPINVALADVANAWQFTMNACDDDLLARNGGLFFERGGDTQLYDIYDRNRYGSDELPLFATTDLFWENFGAAYNGVFIILERRQAVPAFWSFVEAANAAMQSSMANEVRNSNWARAFAALAAMHGGSASGEAGRIAGDTTVSGPSLVVRTFDFRELKPRGHYTTSPEMQQYFRAVHYFTELNKDIYLPDMAPAPLAALPAEVQRKALNWIATYRPFIAQSRSKLVWSDPSAPALPAYAYHPWGQQSVFPLSWGIDNETLESSVFHSTWPVDQQIGTVDGLRRMRPSGLDVATVFGSATARSLLAQDFATFPRLGPVFERIASQRPADSEESSLYDKWLNALAVEWSDSSKFPGAPKDSKLWSAKRLQTGLASWATIREATILVNERPAAAEAGEGGFEQLIPEIPRGYVEPVPKTFEAIAALYDALAKKVARMTYLGGADGTTESPWEVDKPLREGILKRLSESAAEARRFGVMAEKELRKEPLTDAEYEEIRGVGGSAEHMFKLYKSLAEKDLGIPIPEPVPKIADVQGDLKSGLLEVAVGAPLGWRQIAPYFGRRELVVGSVYSYYEFISNRLYDNEMWRKEIGQHARPAWIQPFITPPDPSCRPGASP